MTYVVLAYLGVILIWSTTPLAIKWSVAGLDSTVALGGRIVPSALICWLFVLITRQALPWHRRAVTVYFAASLAIVGTMLCVYWSAQFVSSGLIAIVFGLTPILTGIIAAVWLHEASFTPLRIVAMLLGLLGLYSIYATTYELGYSSVLGLAVLLIGVLLHCSSAVWIKALRTELRPLSIVTGALIVSSVVAVSVWGLQGAAWPKEWSPRGLFSIGYLAIVGSIFGFLLFYYALRHLEAGQMALINLVTPVTALWLGHAINNELVYDGMIWGTIAILLGLAAYQWSAVKMLLSRMMYFFRLHKIKWRDL